jgi:hypothetical protein
VLIEHEDIEQRVVGLPDGVRGFRLAPAEEVIPLAVGFAPFVGERLERRIDAADDPGDGAVSGGFCRPPARQAAERPQMAATERGGVSSASASTSCLPASGSARGLPLSARGRRLSPAKPWRRYFSVQRRSVRSGTPAARATAGSGVSP